jgi:hypothetical protein
LPKGTHLKNFASVKELLKDSHCHCSRISIGQVCWTNNWQYHSVIRPPLLTLASLGGATQIISVCGMGTRQVRLALSWCDTTDCLATNFANVNEPYSIIVVSCGVLYTIDTAYI